MAALEELKKFKTDYERQNIKNKKGDRAESSLFEGSEVLSVDSDESSVEFDSSLLVGNFAKEKDEREKVTRDQLHEEKKHE